LNSPRLDGLLRIRGEGIMKNKLRIFAGVSLGAAIAALAAAPGWTQGGSGPVARYTIDAGTTWHGGDGRGRWRRRGAGRTRRRRQPGHTRALSATRLEPGGGGQPRRRALHAERGAARDLGPAGHAARDDHARTRQRGNRGRRADADARGPAAALLGLRRTGGAGAAGGD